MAKMSTRRKLAIATWAPPNEGNIYGKMTIDATAAQKYIDEQREATGEKITITHLVGKAIALALRKEPTLNGRIVWGKYVPHDSVNITYLVALEEGADLAKVKVDDADTKSVADIAAELRSHAGKLRKGQDEDFEKSKGMLRALPTWLLRPLIRFTGFLTGALGIEMKALGLEAFPFGSCIITSVGMLGIDEGFAPPTPFARVPLYVLLGAIREQPAVVDGEIVIQPQLTLTATIDHRFIDGYQGAVLARTVRDFLADPWTFDNPNNKQLPASEEADAAD